MNVMNVHHFFTNTLKYPEGSDGDDQYNPHDLKQGPNDLLIYLQGEGIQQVSWFKAAPTSLPLVHAIAKR